MSSLSIQVHEPDLEEVRAHIRKLSDQQLREYGNASAFLCRPQPEPPRECFVTALREARAEWRRRHPREKS